MCPGHHLFSPAWSMTAPILKGFLLQELIHLEGFPNVPVDPRKPQLVFNITSHLDPDGLSRWINFRPGEDYIHLLSLAYTLIAERRDSDSVFVDWLLGVTAPLIVVEENMLTCWGTKRVPPMFWKQQQQLQTQTLCQ